uniref:Holin n=1 Tax=viral metagenome TaxID=1070528 RepID=A0A6M3LQM4_9ZZZZ
MTAFRMLEARAAPVDGYKTIGGLVLLGLGLGLQCIGGWERAGEVCIDVGILLSGLGGAHKFIKRRRAANG